MGEVIASRGKARRAEPAKERRRIKRRRTTEESIAHADRPPHAHEGLAQHHIQGLAPDQHPSNPEPGPIELTGSTATSPATSDDSSVWNPTIFCITSVIDDNYNYYNSYAPLLRANSFVAPYLQPSVAPPHPLALPASAPPQGEAAREDEPEGEFDTDQFPNLK